MLKVLGSIAIIVLVGLQLNAHPIQKDIQAEMYALEFSAKDKNIPPATVDLILKESANQLQITYADLCSAYEKDDLIIQKVVTTAGQVAYEVQIGSCSLCILEDDIL